MKLRIRASTGTTVLVWREHDVYYARRLGVARRPEACLPVDLFEVIAELTGLDLDHDDQASEATRLAEYAQDRLADGDDDGRSRDDDGDDTSAESRRRSS
jgi:hypothetical protein